MPAHFLGIIYNVPFVTRSQLDTIYSSILMVILQVFLLEIETVKNLGIAIRIVLNIYSNFLVGRGTHRRILSRRREVSIRTHLS